MTGRVIIGMAAAALAAAGQAGVPTDIVNRHMAAAAASDVDAIVADYADDAIALQNGKAAQGKAAIRAMFAGMFPKPVAGAAKPAGPKMTVTKVWEEGDVGFVTWTAGSVQGSDAFVVRNGKIAVQAVWIVGGPAQAPAK